MSRPQVSRGVDYAMAALGVLAFGTLVARACTFAACQERRADVDVSGPDVDLGGGALPVRPQDRHEEPDHASAR